MYGQEQLLTKHRGDLLCHQLTRINWHYLKSMTSEETLKELSLAIDAYASAKISNNESLIKFAIASLQDFLGKHSITPLEQAQPPSAPPAEASQPSL